MLKYDSNVVPSWDIDWTNKTFIMPNYIGYMVDVIVDWDSVTWYTFLHDTVTLDVAPTTSITGSYFYRAERDIMWNWEVTMWDLIDEVYDEIWRRQYTKIYPKEKIRRDLNKTIWVYLDEMPERKQIQHYSFKWLNGLTVTIEWHTVDIERADSYNLDIEWVFFVWDWLFYEYFDYDGEVFTISWADLIDTWDEILVWHKIPYWVERVAEVYVDWVKLEFIDSRNFNMNTYWNYTIVKDYQWNEYIFLPYSDKEYSCVVKFVPDYAKTTVDEDILDIPYRYTRVFVYDVCYRLLASREDDRWQVYEKLKNEEKKIFKAYKSKTIRKSKNRIWFWKTYDWTSSVRYIDILPDDVYDEYI